MSCWRKLNKIRMILSGWSNKTSTKSSKDQLKKKKLLKSTSEIPILSIRIRKRKKMRGEKELLIKWKELWRSILLKGWAITNKSTKTSISDKTTKSKRKEPKVQIWRCQWVLLTTVELWEGWWFQIPKMEGNPTMTTPKKTQNSFKVCKVNSEKSRSKICKDSWIRLIVE